MSNNEKQHCPKCGAVEMVRHLSRIDFACESEWLSQLGRFYYESQACKERKADRMEEERNQLRAQLETVTKERDRLKEQGKVNCSLFDDLKRFQKQLRETIEQRDTARAHRDRAMRMTRHANNCNRRQIGFPCSCGLDQLHARNRSREGGQMTAINKLSKSIELIEIKRLKAKLQRVTQQRDALLDLFNDPDLEMDDYVTRKLAAIHKQVKKETTK